MKKKTVEMPNQAFLQVYSMLQGATVTRDMMFNYVVQKNLNDLHERYQQLVLRKKPSPEYIAYLRQTEEMKRRMKDTDPRKIAGVMEGFRNGNMKVLEEREKQLHAYEELARQVTSVEFYTVDFSMDIFPQHVTIMDVFRSAVLLDMHDTPTFDAMVPVSAIFEATSNIDSLSTLKFNTDHVLNTVYTGLNVHEYFRILQDIKTGSREYHQWFNTHEKARVALMERCSHHDESGELVMEGGNYLMDVAMYEHGLRQLELDHHEILEDYNTLMNARVTVKLYPVSIDTLDNSVDARQMTVLYHQLQQLQKQAI